MKHVAGWNKSECAKIRMLCFAWIDTTDDYFTQWDDTAQIRGSKFLWTLQNACANKKILSAL